MTFGHCGERRKGTESCKTFTQEMVKWKMERREERNGITKWWKLWERGNGETKKPRKRKKGRRGNGDRENGKMEKSRSGMDSWRNGKFLLWMNGWDEQPNYWLRTTGRKQRLEGRGDGMVMTSYHSLTYPPFPPHPSPPKKRNKGQTKWPLLTLAKYLTYSSIFLYFLHEEEEEKGELLTDYRTQW